MKTYRIKTGERASLAVEIYIVEARNLLEAVVKVRRKIFKDGMQRVYEVESGEMIHNGPVLR